MAAHATSCSISPDSVTHLLRNIFLFISVTVTTPWPPIYWLLCFSKMFFTTQLHVKPFISVTVQHSSNGTSLAAIVTLSNCFGLPNITTDTAKFVIFSSADFWQQDLNLCGFFLLFGNIVVNKTHKWSGTGSLTKETGALIMLIIKPSWRGGLKWSIYNKFVQSQGLMSAT